MQLAELIDLEARLALDEERDPDELRRRDRAIGAGFPTDSLPRSALLSRWLEALRAQDGGGASLGQWMARTYGLVGVALAIAGLGMGWSTATVVLAYDGRLPVNVMSYLWIFVGLQVLLLVALLLSLASLMIGPRLIEALPAYAAARGALGAVFRLMGRGAGRLRQRLPQDRLEALVAAWNRVRQRSVLYRSVERWELLGLTQAFAIAFNLGALLRCLQLIAFSDLAFCWSTTLDLEPGRLHAMTEALALPWRAWLPAARPTLELVELTRYSRLEGSYLAAASGRALDPVVVGGWWRFLVVATATYGLLPRVLSWGAARAARAWALRHIALDTPDVERVVRRLLSPLVQTRAPEAEAGPPRAGVSAPGASPALRRSARSEPVAPATRRCTVVRWRDSPPELEQLEPLVQAALGWSVSRELSAGAADFAQEQRTLQTLAEPTAPEDPVLVLAEAWEPPDRATLRFLRLLRTALGPRQAIVVGLLGPGDGGRWGQVDSADAGLWKERLVSLRDPYLGLELLRSLA